MIEVIDTYQIEIKNTLAYDLNWSYFTVHIELLVFQRSIITSLTTSLSNQVVKEPVDIVNMLDWLGFWYHFGHCVYAIVYSYDVVYMLSVRPACER